MGQIDGDFQELKDHLHDRDALPRKRFLAKPELKGGGGPTGAKGSILPFLQLAPAAAPAPYRQAAWAISSAGPSFRRRSPYLAAGKYT